MAGRGYLQSLTLSCTFGALCWASSLVAEQAGTAPAYQASGAPATTVATGQQASSPTVAKTTAKTEAKTLKITDVKFVEFLGPQEEALYRRSKGKLHSVFQKVRFRLAILGENLACNPKTEVILVSKDPGHPLEEVHTYCSPTSPTIEVSGRARVGTVISAVKVTDACDPAARRDDAGNDQGNDVKGQGSSAGNYVPTTEEKLLASMQCPGEKSAETGKTEATSKCSAISTGLTISIKPIPPESALQEFEIKFEHQQSKEFPNLHSLMVTKQGGDIGVGFDAKESHMRIDLEPTGATDLTVVQSNEEQLELHFVAAPDYEPTNVVITVYNGSDLDKRKAKFVAKVAAPSKPPDKDPNKPTISAVKTVFVDRHAGNGRIRIYGKGFGKHFKAPPFPVDDFLCDCLERPPLDFPKEPRPRTCGTFAGSFSSKKTPGKVEGPEEVTVIEKPAQVVLEQPDKVTVVEKPEKVVVEKPKRATVFEKPTRATVFERPKKVTVVEKPEKVTVFDKLEKVTMFEGPDETERREYCATLLPSWYKWRCSVSAVANVESRDPNIRVEKAEVIDINDEMVDVYFEFTRHHGYAWPFRLAGVDLTIQKPVKKVEQVVKAEQAKVAGEVDSLSPTTYKASSPIGPKPDDELTYRYTVLAYEESRRLLGDGVADNFYVIELSVVNNAAKKVAIPLAAIQAEIEWLYGPVSIAPPASVTDLVNQKDGFFLEGPPTLAPIPMATVSAYFGASKKNGERRVTTFNILEGITTLVTSLVPFAGPGLKSAEVVFSGGFIPGLRHAWGDLTDQQLQNLTTLSWQTSETLAASGGSLEKLIYIQKGAHFQDEGEPIYAKPYTTKQQISNIMSLEVVGYEVNDSPPKEATPAGKKPPADEATKTPPAKKTPSEDSTSGAQPKESGSG
jgi:hypothetical protein